MLFLFIFSHFFQRNYFLLRNFSLLLFHRFIPFHWILLFHHFQAMMRSGWAEVHRAQLYFVFHHAPSQLSRLQFGSSYLFGVTVNDFSGFSMELFLKSCRIGFWYLKLRSSEEMRWGTFFSLQRAIKVTHQCLKNISKTCNFIPLISIISHLDVWWHFSIYITHAEKSLFLHISSILKIEPASSFHLKRKTSNVIFRLRTI